MAEGNGISAPTPRDGEVQQAIAVAVAAVERRDFKGAIELFRIIYEGPDAANAPVTGLSHYGLCVLKVERKPGRAIELAEMARKAEFYDARHWVNLSRIYLESGSRRRAVATLEDGLKRMSKDPILVAFRDEIGYRKGPPIGFLHRDNPINMFLGKNHYLLRPTKTVKIAIVVIWFLALMAVTFYFLMRNSPF